MGGPPRGLTGAARAVALAATFALGAPAAAKMLGVGTSSPGSVFHSSATAIATVANEQANLPMTVQAFASPNVYLPAIDQGQIAFGISNVGDVRLSTAGEMHFEGRALENVRAVAVLFPLRMAIYVTEDSPIRTVSDLRGKRLPTGYAGQKTILPLVNSLLATEGLSTDDVVEVRVPNIVAGANAFIEGKADAFFFAVGAAKVREADAAMGGIRSIPLINTPESLAAIQEVWPVGYLLEVEPGPAAAGVTERSSALTHDAILVSSTLTPDEDVYALVQALHDNPDALANAFAAFRLFDPDRMQAEYPDVEWHPGALAFYRDAGVLGAAE